MKEVTLDMNDCTGGAYPHLSKIRRGGSSDPRSLRGGARVGFQFPGIITAPLAGRYTFGPWRQPWKPRSTLDMELRQERKITGLSVSLRDNPLLGLSRTMSAESFAPAGLTSFLNPDPALAPQEEKARGSDGASMRRHSMSRPTWWPGADRYGGRLETVSIPISFPTPVLVVR